MEGPAPYPETQASQITTPPSERSWKLLILLLVLAAGMRTWVVANTEVMSRDAHIYIDYALQLESRPWQEVLLGNHQHPGYPLTILAASVPVSQVLGRTDCVAMQLSAQLVSAIAGVLMVVPMFFLGKILFNARVSFWAALLFQCLPVSGKILSDGLSESLFLLLVATALLLAVQGIRLRTPWRFIPCGLCGGLAYLIRPEAVVIVGVIGLVLLIMQGVPLWRRGWRWTIASGTCLALTALAAGSPYYLATGQFTNKPSGKTFVPAADSDEATPSPAARAHDDARHVQAAVVFAPAPLAVWLNRDLSLPERLGTGLRGVLSEVLKGFHFVAWLPALLGLWWERRRLLPRPEAWLIALLMLVDFLILWRLAMVAGYVSERHVVLLVMCGLLPAAACLLELPRLVGASRAWALVLLLALIGASLCRTLQPLHANRAGHHAAGLWLAQHAGPDDEVADSHFGWAKFYAGRPVYAKDPVAHGPDFHATRFVVKGSSLERVNPYGQTNSQADMTEQEIKEAGGRPVFHWPERSPLAKAKVVVWAVSLPITRSQ
jgi:4-amino-4-deoxy-L-arabinose transferase-like glycosyltransferase